MRKLLGISLIALAPALAHAESRSTLDARSAATERGDVHATYATPAVGRRSMDPADSLYRAAKDALNDGDWRRAASLFHRVTDRYPRSAAAGDALYWEAFALYRIGDERALRDALGRLDVQRSRFPNASTAADAKTLATRIQGRLAQLGDAGAAGSVVAEAGGDKSDKADKSGKSSKVDKAGRKGGGGDDTACRTRGARGDDDDEGGDGGDGDSDQRIAALNALMQMDASRAMPILRQVLARRDACSEVLRRKAVFLVAQQNTPDAADILLDAARNDPDRQVRRQAIFWLSQVHSERASAALDSILHAAGADEELRERAIFALAQHNTSRSRTTLRDFAKSDAPVDLRRKAVFWLGQQDRSADNAAFFRALFDSPAGAPLRDEIIQAAANGEESDAWLLSVARDPKQDLEQRKKALFWLGQQGRVPTAEFAKLYDTLADRDVKEHLIFVLSQRRETAAVDKLIDIARHDTDRSLRGKALFWLGQSDDPRVKQVLMEIINQ
ncbi:MAG TPA: HEAT repeat domain-containing protein [Gemmatimonadaceae bacterium]|nr:HEAT repeat domain-containing protein [Gemmatimonadaceae bacterium]